jgi:hypothetical protein
LRSLFNYLSSNKTEINPKIFLVEKLDEEDNGFEPTVWVDTKLLWSRIENAFHLNYNDIQSILKVWLKETYNFEEISVSQASLGLDFDFD